MTRPTPPVDAAASEADHPASPAGRPHRGSGAPTLSTGARGPRWITVALLAFIGLGVGGAAGIVLGATLTSEPQSAPAEGSVDAGFARDMQAHHEQAVQMSLLALERTEDPQVRTLASDVLLTQQQQAGQMFGWLDQWNLPQSSPTERMAWVGGMDEDMPQMDHASPDGSGSGDGEVTAMPGMATAEDLARLRDATGSTADRVYLELMIPHHQAGVAMAQVAADRATDPDVRRLAQAIVGSQRAELDVLRDMLAARGGPLTR